MNADEMYPGPTDTADMTPDSDDPIVTSGMFRPEMTTEQMRERFEVVGFQAPFVVVRRKADGQLGSLQFTHSPRVYFGWQPHEETR